MYRAYKGISGTIFVFLPKTLICQTPTIPPKKDKPKEKDPLKPDPETLHTTDPQEEMEGPVSSIMQNMKKSAEENDEESKREADRKKDKNT